MLVVATPAGQIHELGALLVGAAAANLGWHVTYLGASLPAAEIAGAARQNRARAVALSLVYPEDDPRLEGELTRLRESLPPEVVAPRRRTRHAGLPRCLGRNRRRANERPRAPLLDPGRPAQTRKESETMKPFFSRNIDNKGRLVRGLVALALLVGAGFGFTLSVWLSVALLARDIRCVRGATRLVCAAGLRHQDEAVTSPRP